VHGFSFAGRGGLDFPPTGPTGCGLPSLRVVEENAERMNALQQCRKFYLQEKRRFHSVCRSCKASLQDLGGEHKYHMLLIPSPNIAVPAVYLRRILSKIANNNHSISITLSLHLFSYE
jgi:hypothetical protein